MRIINFVLYSCLYFTLSNFCINAQQSKNNFTGLSIGGSNFHILDELASPLISRGTGIAPSINFFHNGLKNSHYLDGAFYYHNLSTSSDNFKTEIFGGRFRYSFLRSVLTRTVSGKQFSIAAGASFSSFFSKSDYMFYKQTFWATTLETWYGSHSVDLSGMVGYQFNEHNSLNLKVYLPVISNVSRPAFSSSGDYNYEELDWDVKAFGKTVFFPENFSVNTHLSYQRVLSKRIRLYMAYEFYFASYDQPDLVQLYMNNFRIGIYYGF